MDISKSNLLQSVIDANGGLEYWASVESISVTCLISGATLARKGYPGCYDVTATIDTKTQKVVFERFGTLRGIFTPTRTEVGTVGSRFPLDVRDNPMDAFKDHDGTAQWDPHNLIFFAGYSFWYYFNIPFFLHTPQFQTQEMESHKCSNGEVWSVLRVEFPEGFITHTKIQKLYFDDKFRLRQMDYHVDLIPGNPDPIPARHYCYNHKSFGNLNIPTSRIITLSPSSVSHVCAFILQGVEVQIRTSTDKD